MDVRTFTNVNLMFRFNETTEGLKEYNDEGELGRQCEFILDEVFMLPIVWTVVHKLSVRSEVKPEVIIQSGQINDLELSALESRQNL
jgi:hypothetical protein